MLGEPYPSRWHREPGADPSHCFRPTCPTPSSPRTSPSLNRSWVWGGLAEEYKTVSGNALADDTQLSTLLRVVPAQLRNHLQLSMEEDADYGKIREKVVSYERTTSLWSSQAVLQGA